MGKALPHVPVMKIYCLVCNVADAAVASALLAFLVIGSEQARRGAASPLPTRKGLDSRTRVRRPSMTGGTGSCATPRMTKIISAASPGESTLELIPTA